jgi:solute carrier family 20 (sodium-dependent phosphate transporter)
MSSGKTAAVIILTGLVIAVLAILFWIPYVHAKVVKKDYTIKFWHFFWGPFLWKRQPPADAGQVASVPDYRIRETLAGDVVGDTPGMYESTCFDYSMAKG